MLLTLDAVFGVTFLVALVLIVVGIHLAAPVDRTGAAPSPRTADVDPRRTLS